MNTTVRDDGAFEKILTLDLPEEAIQRAKNQAARKLAKEIKIKGFRPGKAPTRVVEAAVGVERLRTEAIDGALPEVVSEAIVAAELRPAVPPSVEDIRHQDSGVQVDVRVTLWPKLEDLPRYRGRSIEVSTLEVPEEDVTAQIDRLREQYAELDVVDRPAGDEDYVTINLSTTRNGEVLEGASANELLYEIGSESFVPGLDEHLVGASKGDIVAFDGALPAGFGEHGGATVTFTVLVKDVREKRLPELTDDWTSDVTEFDTVVELRDELSSRLLTMQRGVVANEFRTKLLEALVEDMDVEIPEAIIRGEMESILHRFSHELGEQGIQVADYLRVTGQTQEAFVEDLRAQAERNVATDILLDAVVEAEGLEASADEYEDMVNRLAEQAGEPADDLLERWSDTNQEIAIRGDILRRKALETLLRGAEPVDEAGNPVDLLEEPLADDGDEEIQGEVAEEEVTEERDA